MNLPPLEEKDDVWNKIIIQAEQDGYFNQQHVENVKRWRSCAVGKLFKIPKMKTLLEEGTYVEERYGIDVIILGSRFSKLVRENDFKGVKETYAELKLTRNSFLMPTN